MKTQILATLALLSLASARPHPNARGLRAREVPQEHSHNIFLASVRTSLATNNPDGIVDPVFGLLGNAAAAAGLGKITDTECLQQATADQAFTNAKTANDIQAMTDALIYQALERNTGAVGLASNSCTSITPVNAEIAAIQRHQDPASTNAATINKASTLALAQQIKAIGGNATQALQAGTFAPGTIGDPTAAGNTCDVADDTEGCIFTENKLVEDFTPDELNAALASGSSATASNTTAAATGSTAATSSAADSSAADSCAADTAAATTTTAAAAAAATADTSSDDGEDDTCEDDSDTAAASTATATPTTASTATSTLDFGSCGVAPLITFGAGFDGRTEESFEFEDLSAFNHGSADNIAVLTSFAVGQLQSACKASADTVSAAEAAASAVTGQTGETAANTWNAAFQ